MKPALIAALLRFAVRLLATTWRVDTLGHQHMAWLRATRSPTVYAVWHGHFLPVLWRHRRELTALLVSTHRDGEYLARTASRWGYRVVRGSSTRGARAGLRRLLRVLEGGGEVALAPDGPAGPPQRAKRGAAAVAQRTGAAVVAVGAAASKHWRLRSWDGFMIPFPFARVRIVYSAPFWVGAGGEGVQDGTERLQASLATATEVACVS